MNNKISNWQITTYNDNDEYLTHFEIEDRTEREAEKEAMGDVRVRLAADWTMKETN